VCEVGSAFECTGYVRTHACRSVCVRWGAALEQTQVSSNAGPCLRSNVQGTFERIVQFFFLQNIYILKIFTTNTQTKIFTHIFT
jgi:hypothetical protein